MTTKRHTLWSSRSWIIVFLEMYKISGEVIKFIENTMENWRVELTTGGKSLTLVKIQGDALSLLRFVIGTFGGKVMNKYSGILEVDTTK